MSTWRDYVREVEPYVPGEQPDLPDMVKLNTNENPYPPSPAAERTLREFEAGRLRLYPDPNSKVLVNAIAERYHLSADEIYVGVGSDDVLAIAFLTFFNSEKPILFPDITYSFYDVWAGLFRIPYERKPLDEEFQVRVEDYYGENGGVVIANPNAPTGVRQSEESLRRLIEHNRDVAVIIDEAYVDFGGASALNLAREYDNVIIVQTGSKSRSLAGLRVGYAMGNAEMIRAMNSVRLSFNSYPISRISEEVGAAVIRDVEYFNQTVGRIVETREWAKKEFRRLGFHFADSETNFVFVEHESVSAEEIFNKLREKNIFVRHFQAPRIENYLRVTVGSREEMERFFAQLEKIVGDGGTYAR